MTGTPPDSRKKLVTIDKAKEAGRYDEAAEAAIEGIRSLAGGDVQELDAHPLVEVYVQELVRSEAIRLMKLGEFHGGHQFMQHVRSMLSEHLGRGMAELLDGLLCRWVSELGDQLQEATEVTERKKVLYYEGETPTIKRNEGRYEFEIQDRGAGHFALLGRPLTGNFETLRVVEALGPQVGGAFPFEIDSEEYIFLVDYDGAILSYGDHDSQSLLQAARSLAQRLEGCFAPV